MESSVNPTRLTTALSAIGIRWSTADDGNVVAYFATQAGAAPTIIVYSVEGTDGDVLSITSPLVVGIDPDDWPRTIGVLNTWNSGHRWPCASLRLDASEGTVVGNTNFIFPRDDDELCQLLQIATATIGQCRRWLADHLATTPASGQVHGR